MNHYSPVGMTQTEVAKELGTTQDQVSRLEQSAMRKLRALPEAKALLKFCRFDSKE